MMGSNKPLMGKKGFMIDSNKASTNLQLVNEHFYAGYITQLIRKKVFDEFNLAGYFPVDYVNQKQITVTDVWDGVEDVKEQTKGRGKKLAAKGTSLRRVRYSQVTPEGFKLEQYGIELEIEIKDLNERQLNYNDLMRPIAITLADEIDKNVYRAAMEVATDPSTEYGLTKQWSTKEIKDIISDITKIRNYKRKEGYRMDTCVLGMEALTQLEIKSEVQGMWYEFPKTGLTIEDAFDIAGMKFSWGGGTMDDKELLAFSRELPPLQLFYYQFDNPNVHRVPNFGHYAKYAPAINVLQWDNSQTEYEPTLTMQFTTGVGTYPLEKGKRLLKVEDILN